MRGDISRKENRGVLPTAPPPHFCFSEKQQLRAQALKSKPETQILSLPVASWVALDKELNFY